MLFQLLFMLTNHPLSVSNVQIQTRIHSGTQCNYEDYPFILGIYNRRALCGGSMLTLEWVLTAAHCVNLTDLKDQHTLLRSGFQYTGRHFVQIRYGKKGFPHPKFDIKKMRNRDRPELRYDIGLIQADKPFETGKLLKVGKLPTPGFTKNCTLGTVAGIGLQEFETVENQHYEIFDRPLMCASLPIVGANVCRQTYKRSVVDDSVICTMDPEAKKDACKGDSGGPLVCNQTIIGIISYGIGCAKPNKSASFTKVEHYLDFIHETMKPDVGSRGHIRRAECLFDGIFIAFWCYIWK